jgi:hypothetical protein
MLKVRIFTTRDTNRGDDQSQFSAEVLPVDDSGQPIDGAKALIKTELFFTESEAIAIAKEAIRISSIVGYVYQ